MKSLPVFLLPLLAIVMLVRPHTLTDDCIYWKQAADSLSHLQPSNMPFAPTIKMHCDAGCANITCSGNLKMSNVFGMNIDVDFCFGVQENPCAELVAIQYYVDMPQLNVSLAGNLTHTATYEIPLPVPSPSPLLSDVKLVQDVEMVKVNESAIKLKITSKIRIMEGSLPLFPFEKVIFPETIIDIPECPKDQSELNKFKAPQTCIFSKPAITTTSQAPINITSNTYHQSCEIGLWKCNRNEMCVSDADSPSRNGICQCEPDATLSPNTGYCEKAHSTSTTSLPSDSQKSTDATKGTNSHSSSTTSLPSNSQKSTDATKGTNLIPIIIGSVVSVLVLIVVGILVIVFIGRRKRVARYREHQQLLSDDMMDNEDDFNVAI